MSLFFNVSPAYFAQAVLAYLVSYSLRFDGTGTNDYLNRVVTDSNRRTWTWSAWVKKNDLGTRDYLFSGGAAGVASDLFYLQWEDNDNGTTRNNQLYVNWREGITEDPPTRSLGTSASYNDTSAWYHVVLSVDTTKSNSSDKMKLYIDGTEASYNPSADDRVEIGLNDPLSVNAAGNLCMSAYAYNPTSTTSRFKGQMAEVHFIDGTAYDASYFGETRNGVWVPKEVTGVTYGTNGFYLDFKGNGAGVTLLLDGTSTTDVSGVSTVTPSGSGYTTNNTTGAKFNQYIDFQNSPAGYFNVAFPSALGVSNEPFTVETWAYFDAIANDGVFQLYKGSSILDGSFVNSSNSIAVAVNSSKWSLYDYGNNNTNLGTAATGTWYHVAVVYDGTNLVFYVDGVALKTTARSMPAGGWTSIGIGGYYTTAYVMDGRIEDFRVTKGVARYSDTFTPPTSALTNTPEYLGDFGVDRTTNNNDFSVEGNITPDDQLLDTPNLRFATLDPSFRGGTDGEVLSEGNLKYYCPISNENYVAATEGKTSGKWYFETLYDGSTNNTGQGIVGWTYDDISQSSVTTINPYDLDYGGMFGFQGWAKVDTADITAVLQAPSPNDVIGVAFDADTQRIWFSVQGSWVQGDPGTGTVATSYGALTATKTYIPFIGHYSSSSTRRTQAILNFGQDHTFAGKKSAFLTPYSDTNGVGEFRYQPPTGFKALVTEYK